MRRSGRAHKRSRFSTSTVAMIAALALGGGGAAVVVANASGTQFSSSSSSPSPSPQPSQSQVQTQALNTATIDCPDLTEKLTDVPERARTEVDRNLAKMDSQVAEAYRDMAASWDQGGWENAKNTVVPTLEEKRRATIDRIVAVLEEAAASPGGLRNLVECTLKRAAGAQQGDASDSAAPSPVASDPAASKSGEPGDGGQSGAPDDGGQDAQQPTGPSPDDFVDITKAEPNVSRVKARQGGSTGSFTTFCGTNGERHLNSDNVIAAPGVDNGAHHVHDYVGNLDTSAKSTDSSLAAAGTTCDDQDDKSTYYWPVLRVQDGKDEKDAKAAGGGLDGNVGTILRPAAVKLTFKGSPVSKVTEMPRFLRIITGDAKSFTNGDANANASWSCTGFESKVQLKDKYPLCPEGSKVVRTFEFQSCWDGKNTDSANHRTHVDFAQKDGSCKEGFKAVPQLVQKVLYDVPRGQVFAVDSFPEQLHKPVTDHSDFINVMSKGLMERTVKCINTGFRCR